MKTLIQSALEASRIDDDLRYWKNISPHHNEVYKARLAVIHATIRLQMKTARKL